MTLDRYPPAESSLIESVSFEHEGRAYRGEKGYLTWEPDRGFHIEARMSLVRGEPFSVIRPPAGPREGTRLTVTMELPDGQRAIGRDVPLVWDYALHSSNRLVIDSDTLEFQAHSDRPGQTAEWKGAALYTFPTGVPLPHLIERVTTFPLSKVRGTDYETGIDAQSSDGEASFVAHRAESDRLKVHWVLPGSTWAADQAWLWPEALGLALRLVYGYTAPLLWREMKGQSDVRTETCRRSLPRWLWFLPCQYPLEDHVRLLQKASSYLARRDGNAATCWNIIGQMTESAKQQTYPATELLLAIVMEAMFRHVLNKPFRCQRKGNSINIQDRMPEFMREHLTSDWERVCDHAVVVQARLRQRNAHPDWMNSDPSVKPWTLPDVRIADLGFLAEFYRGVVFALAGLKEASLGRLQMRAAHDLAEAEGNAGTD